MPADLAGAFIFKVTHIDAAAHRRRARVVAASTADAMDQMEQVYGVAQGGGCLRLAVTPVLRLVGAVGWAGGVDGMGRGDLHKEAACRL